MRPTTYSSEYPGPRKVTGCIRRMVRGGRVQIPAYAGMTGWKAGMTWQGWDGVGACGDDVGACGDDVGACGNDVGACGNDVGASRFPPTRE